MLILKRILCGLIALCVMSFGLSSLSSDSFFTRTMGYCFSITGIVLMYISIWQKLPKYNFWITLFSIGLLVFIYSILFSPSMNIADKNDSVKMKPVKVEKTAKKTANTIKKMKKTKKTVGFDFSKYPRVYGVAKYISANVFYVGGRYVRLYGVDSPDVDQVCSNTIGNAYNCGSEALSWVIEQIDNSPIECYLFKVNHQGVDIATCLWNGNDIGAMVVGAGWGIAKTDETDIYKPYEAKAQTHSIGLWQGSFYLPEDWREIKRQQNNFTIKRKKSSGSWFKFSSWF